MAEEFDCNRRRWLRAAGVALTGGLAGCVTSDASAEPPERVPFDSDATCADGFEIVEEDARIALGTQPTLTLRLHNAGGVPISFAITVIFKQGTSTGRPIQTGNAELHGLLDPGDTVSRTATSDARDIENTRFYDLSVSLECPSDT